VEETTKFKMNVEALQMISSSTANIKVYLTSYSVLEVTIRWLEHISLLWISMQVLDPIFLMFLFSNTYK